VPSTGVTLSFWTEVDMVASLCVAHRFNRLRACLTRGCADDDPSGGTSSRPALLLKGLVLHALVLPLIALSLMLAPARADGPEEVDVALVLAVDISYSMDLDELAVQRQGYVDALRSEQFLEAVRRGAIGKVAITYFEWAGSGTHYLLAPWIIVDGPASANQLASRLEAQPVRRAYRTSISAAIDMGVKLLDESGVKPMRKVIDVSDDGPNNQGRLVTIARDEAVQKGITINGLPLMLKRPGYLDLTDLDTYYKECVIGGQGSFVIPVRDGAQFANAIRTKLILEVAGLTPPQPVIHRAQARPTSSCLIGERQWQQRMGN
jgi:hypothetical protein